MAKSPLDITYNDLIKLQELRLEWMEKEYPKMIIAMKIKRDTANHNLECQRVLVRMLKKHKKNPQLNLNDEFDKIVK